MTADREELTNNLRTALPAETHEAFDALMDAYDDRLQELEGELDEAKELDCRETLETVRYWLLNVLVHNKPVSDPRKILRTIEAALNV